MRKEFMQPAMGHGTLRAGLSRSVICLKTCFGERNRKTKIEVSRSRKLSHLQAKLQKSKLGTALCYPPCWRGFLLFSSSLNSLSLKASFSIKSFLTPSQNLSFFLCVSLAQIGLYLPSTCISFCPSCWCSV